MKTFKDCKGRDWEISITIGAVKRVRDLLNVDLCNLKSGEPSLLERLGSDDVFLIDVLYCLVKEQADAKGINDEDFGAAMDGKATVAADKAFWDELESFFQSRGRTDTAKAIATFSRLREKTLALSVTKLDAKLETLDLDKAAESIISAAESRLQESSASTPTPEHSANSTG